MLKIVLAIVAVLIAAALWVVAQNVRDEASFEVKSVEIGPDAVARGEYLALVGNCAGCHTARGGAAYAGGRAIPTPFGTVHATNITPDDETGIGRWTAAEFWRAMHNGRSRDGRLLVPAFPYPQMTLVTREDAIALYAYLRTVPAVRQPNRAQTLDFPYNTQVALAVWRAFFFEPQTFQPDPAMSAEWNRGAYLVRGLGHCTACHASRNIFGASREAGAGGAELPAEHWYAPSLAAPAEAGVSDWDVAEIVALMKNGVAPRGSVMGPMAEVVFRSTQYLSDADARAMAAYLKSLPPEPKRDTPRLQRVEEVADVRPERGARLYSDHCEDCHGPRGEGAPGAYPPLAGSRAATMEPPLNAIRAVLEGGFLPATVGNPRPFGMPPFGHVMTDIEVAAVLTHVRSSWGNQASFVSSRQVQRARGW